LPQCAVKSDSADGDYVISNGNPAEPVRFENYLQFSACFPGRLCSVQKKIYSFLHEGMEEQQRTPTSLNKCFLDNLHREIFNLDRFEFSSKYQFPIESLHSQPFPSSI